DYEAWDMRHSGEVHQQAVAWRGMTTKSAREKHQRETGVCWSPLHDLPYYDPVCHLILGFMHNTLEGILQYHLRDLW
ncbi:hypothetical protein K435DRAFT_561704, partial [Dendrothele bispora CBS 962.96]